MRYKRMGSRLWLVAGAVLLVAATGCGRREEALARIRREGVLRWGADPAGGAPFVYFDPNDPSRVIGFEIDIMQKFAAHMGVKAEMAKNDWAALIDNMLAGRSDMVMNGIEINPARASKVLFSKPYYRYEQQLTVRTADREKYKTLSDLKGRKIATLNAAEANNVLEREGFTSRQISQYDDSLTPYTELEIGRVDGALQESIIAAYYAGGNPKLHNVPETFSPGEYAVAIRKGDESLLAECDRILALMKQNGELAEIYRKWKIWTPQQADVGVKDAAK